LGQVFDGVLVPAVGSRLTDRFPGFELAAGKIEYPAAPNA
jgi:hypothetical protein